MTDVEPKQVLIGLVDDEPRFSAAIRRTLLLQLEERGHTPKFLMAANPLDFLQQLADTRDEVQLVLSDTNMPYATGLDLVELLAHRIAKRDIPDYFKHGAFREAYYRIAHDTIRQTRIVLLSGQYNEDEIEKPVSERWTNEGFRGQHRQLLISLADMQSDLPRGFFDTVLSKPYNSERLRQVVFDALGIA